MRKGQSDFGQEAAQTLAISALTFLASDPQRLSRFLDMVGVEASGIRQAAAEPGFLGAVLSHLMTDEALLLTFAANEGVTPESVVKAARSLGNEPWERGYA